MSASAVYPATVRTQPGSPQALAVTADAVIALVAAIAGAALLAGIATGSAIEAPDGRGARIIRPAETTSPMTSTASTE